MRLHVVLGGLVLIALACGGLSSVRVVNAGGDDGCSGLFEYCVVVRCALENESRSPATVDLSYVMTQADGRADKFTEQVTLGPKEMRTFTHDFNSATLSGGLSGGGKVECKLR